VKSNIQGELRSRQEVLVELTPVSLAGKAVFLEPLSAAQVPEVTTAALSAPEVWAHIPWAMQDAAQVGLVLARALEAQASGVGVTFVMRWAATREIVGGTSVRLVDGSLPSIEIGGTWVLPAWQRTRVNTECKLLLLEHCFERLGCLRVELKTDVRNTRSQAAIARLGAMREGVLRSHMRRADGSARDSVLFSIIAAEWPASRARLQARLERG
jgi:RimJ/RimL family protein N-acetyltransferase